MTLTVKETRSAKERLCDLVAADCSDLSRPPAFSAKLS